MPLDGHHFNPQHRHLSALKRVGLIGSRRDGVRIYWNLPIGGLPRFFCWLRRWDVPFAEHGPGDLPNWLHPQGVDVVLTWGMGPRAMAAATDTFMGKDQRALRAEARDFWYTVTIADVDAQD